jgi:two-component system, NarL family, sensor histidine kinase UhpB
MEKETHRHDEFAAEYKDALQRYLRRGGEAGLQRAYELGRRCLAEGVGVLNMVALHHAAIEEIFSGAKGSARLNGDSLSKAGIFFAQTMSPFEITHRAVGEANEALRHMNETLEEEVKRIAHALHSEAGQLLAAVHLSLDRAERELNISGPSQFQEIKNLLDGVDRQIRRLSHELRPTLLDDLGLVAAIEFLSEGVSKRSGLRIKFRPSNVKRLPPALETVLYRAIQEALNNVAKHAQAKTVRIRLSRAQNVVSCIVADDGVGFDPRAFKTGTKERGLGLIGIREKLQPLSGTVRLFSSPGQGTKLIITVPQED